LYLKLVETFLVVSDARLPFILRDCWYTHLLNIKDNVLTISFDRVILASADRLRPTIIDRDRPRL